MTSPGAEPSIHSENAHRVISYTARREGEVSPGDWTCDGVFGRLPGPPWTLDLRCWPAATLMRDAIPPDDAWPRFDGHWTRLDRVLELTRKGAQGSGVVLDGHILVVCGAVPDKWVAAHGSNFNRWASCIPDRPAMDWALIGYDVIDDTFSSVLRGSGEFSVSARASDTGEYKRLRSLLNARLLMPSVRAAADLADFVDAHAEGGSSATVPCAIFLVPAQAHSVDVCREQATPHGEGKASN